MAVDKSLISGSTTLLILSLLEEKDMYGYEMIDTLKGKSNNVFELKAGTLYPLLHSKEMCRVMDEMKDVVFELIFVDDGSSDATLGIMKDLNEKDSRCRYLSFSRNFGKEAAIYAGLKASEGDYVALMDVDLQDPPTLLPEMYEILQEDGYDNVATKRVTRTGEPRIRSFLSESFYKFVNAISKTEIVDGARD